MYAYSDPSRSDDPTALPNVEVFFVSAEEFANSERGTWQFDAVMTQVCREDKPPKDITDWSMLAGWYWWPCFPGCLPDGDPIGPFETETAALANAQDS